MDYGIEFKKNQFKCELQKYNPYIVRNNVQDAPNILDTNKISGSTSRNASEYIVSSLLPDKTSISKDSWETSIRNRFDEIEKEINSTSDTLTPNELVFLNQLSNNISLFSETYVKKQVHELDCFIWDFVDEHSKKNVQEELDQIFSHEQEFCKQNNLIFPWSDPRFKKEHQVGHGLVRSLCHLHPENIRKLILHFAFQSNLLQVPIDKQEDFWKTKEEFLKELVGDEATQYSTLSNDWDMRFQNYIVTHPTILKNICVGLVKLNTTCCLIPFANEWRSKTAFYEQHDGPFYKFLHENQEVTIFSNNCEERISLKSNSKFSLNQLCKLNNEDYHLLIVRQWDLSFQQFEGKEYTFTEYEHTEESKQFKDNVLLQIQKTKKILSYNFWKDILLRGQKSLDATRSLYVEVDPLYTNLDQSSQVWLHTWFVNEIITIEQGNVPFPGLHVLFTKKQPTLTPKNRLLDQKVAILNSFVLQDKLQSVKLFTNFKTSGYYNLNPNNTSDIELCTNIIQYFMSVSMDRAKTYYTKIIEGKKNTILDLMYSLLQYLTKIMNNYIYSFYKIVEDNSVLPDFKKEFLNGSVFHVYFFEFCDSCKWCEKNILHLIKNFVILLASFNPKSFIADQYTFYKLFEDFLDFIFKNSNLLKKDMDKETQEFNDQSVRNMVSSFKAELTQQNKKAIESEKSKNPEYFVKEIQKHFWNNKNVTQHANVNDLISRLTNYKFKTLSDNETNYVNKDKMLSCFEIHIQQSENDEMLLKQISLLREICKYDNEEALIEISKIMKDKESKLQEIEEREKQKRKELRKERKFKEKTKEIEEKEKKKKEEEERKEAEEERKRVEEQRSNDAELIRLLGSKCNNVNKRALAGMQARIKDSQKRPQKSTAQLEEDAKIHFFTMDQFKELFKYDLPEHIYLPSFMSERHNSMSEQSQRHLIQQILESQIPHLKTVPMNQFDWNDEANFMWTVDDSFERNVTTMSEQAIILHNMLGSKLTENEQMYSLEDLAKQVLKFCFKIDPFWSKDSTSENLDTHDPKKIQISHELAQKTMALASIIEEAKQFTEITESQLASVLHSFQIQHLFVSTESDKELYEKLIDKVQVPKQYAGDIMSWLENTNNFEEISNFWKMIFENKKKHGAKFNMDVAVNIFSKSDKSGRGKQLRIEAQNYLDQLEHGAEPIKVEELGVDSFQYAQYEKIANFPKRDTDDGKRLYNDFTPEKFLKQLKKSGFIDPNDDRIPIQFSELFYHLQKLQKERAAHRRKIEMDTDLLTLKLEQRLKNPPTRHSEDESRSESLHKPDTEDKSTENSAKKSAALHQTENVTQVRQSTVSTVSTLKWKPTVLQHYPYRCPICQNQFLNLNECLTHLEQKIDSVHYGYLLKMNVYKRLTLESEARCEINNGEFYKVKDHCTELTTQTKVKSTLKDEEGFTEVDDQSHYEVKYRYNPIDSTLQGPIITKNDPFYQHIFYAYDYITNALNYVFGYTHGSAYKSAQFDHNKNEGMNPEYKIQLFETSDQTAARVARTGFDEYEPDTQKLLRRNVFGKKSTVKRDRNLDRERGPHNRDKNNWRDDLYDEQSGRNDAYKEDRDLDDHNVGYRRRGVKVGGRWVRFKK